MINSIAVAYLQAIADELPENTSPELILTTSAQIAAYMLVAVLSNAQQDLGDAGHTRVFDAANEYLAQFTDTFRLVTTP